MQSRWVNYKVDYDFRDCTELCEWLGERGLTLEECTHILSYIGRGDPFPEALIHFFNDKRLREEL